MSSVSSLWSLYKSGVKVPLPAQQASTSAASSCNAQQNWLIEQQEPEINEPDLKKKAQKCLQTPEVITEEQPVCKKWANYKAVKQFASQPSTSLKTTASATTTWTPRSDDVPLLDRLSLLCSVSGWPEPELKCYEGGAFPTITYVWTVTVNGVTYKPPEVRTVKHVAKIDALKYVLAALGADAKTETPVRTKSSTDGGQQTLYFCGDKLDWIDKHKDSMGKLNIPKVPDAKAHMQEENPGMKLMKQMGWQPGKGLGTNQQGIAQPIQVTTTTTNTGRVEKPVLGREDLVKSTSKKKKKKRKKAVVVDIEEAWYNSVPTCDQHQPESQEEQVDYDSLIFDPNFVEDVANMVGTDAIDIGEFLTNSDVSIRAHLNYGTDEHEQTPPGLSESLIASSSVYLTSQKQENKNHICASMNRERQPPNTPSISDVLRATDLLSSYTNVHKGSDHTDGMWPLLTHNDCPLSSAEASQRPQPDIPLLAATSSSSDHFRRTGPRRIGNHFERYFGLQSSVLTRQSTVTGRSSTPTGVSVSARSSPPTCIDLTQSPVKQREVGPSNYGEWMGTEGSESAVIDLSVADDHHHSDVVTPPTDVDCFKLLQKYCFKSGIGLPGATVESLVDNTTLTARLRVTLIVVGYPPFECTTKLQAHHKAKREAAFQFSLKHGIVDERGNLCMK